MCYARSTVTRFPSAVSISAAASCLVPLLLGIAACRPARGREPEAGFERMREQQHYTVYESTAVFPNGTVMQAPPPGTVAVEAPIGPAATLSGSVGGTPVSTIPVPVTAEMVVAGQERFHIYCAACHGAGGFGGSVVAANMEPPRPPSLREQHATEHSAGELYSVITNGKGRMPPFAWALSVPQRWAVVAYIGALQRPHQLSPAEREDSLRAVSIDRRPAGSPWSGTR